ACWQGFRKAGLALEGVERVVLAGGGPAGRPEGPPAEPAEGDGRVVRAEAWLPRAGSLPTGPSTAGRTGPEDLATIVYTSGTTGPPKGVMLSHHNLLWNAWAALQAVPAYREDLFLSFLPLSHTLERTAGLYLPMTAGATVAYARSVAQLAEDLRQLRPTVLIAVPRIFERVRRRLEEGLGERSLRRRLLDWAVATGWARFEHAQGRAPWGPRLLAAPLLDALAGRPFRARFGGRLRVAICGGAPLRLPEARLFIGLGIPLLQGYGLTEASPVVSVNRLEDNDPRTVGRPLEGVRVRLGEQDELLVRSPGVTRGYWKRPEATAALLDPEGWLHTGDQAALEGGRIRITGRIKEIIVLANGEKVPPADLEAAITEDPAFDQALVLGEGRPYLAALVVPEPGAWREACAALGLDPEDPAAARDPRAERWALERIGPRLAPFPGYARVRRAAVLLEPWTVDNGLLTPTLKPKRARILERHAGRVAELYEGH
ncbi:MAG: long-chain fatty acid--CoA ligase, partial [Gammaproteobacteria bacterium]